MLKDCKQCGFPWPKLDDEGKCRPCVTEAEWAKDKDVARDATAAERARIVAMAREMADALVDRPGCEMDAFVDGEVRKALLALVERVER